MKGKKKKKMWPVCPSTEVLGDLEVISSAQKASYHGDAQAAMEESGVTRASLQAKSA